MPVFNSLGDSCKKAPANPRSYASHLSLFWVVIWLSCIVSPQNDAVASQASSQKEEVRTLLYIPQEPATLFWERDLGVARAQVKGCENLDPAAEWFDLCKNLLGLSPTFVNLSLGDSHSPLQSPRVLLKAGRRRIRVEFKPILPTRQAVSVAKSRPPLISRNAQTGNLFCEAKVAPDSGLSVVRTEWKIARKGQEAPLVVEEAILPVRLFEGATDVRCRSVLFDGLLFLNRDAAAPPALYSSTSPVDASPIELQPDTLSLFEAGTRLGRLRAGESYNCETLWSEGRDQDPCIAFDELTGRFTPRLLTETGARNGTRGPALFQVQLTRRDGEDVQTQVATPLLVDAGPTLSKPALVVSLARDTFTEHLECRGPDGSLPLEPVRWEADGRPIQGWQQSYLPAFLLAAGGKYKCFLGQSTSDVFLYDDDEDAFRVPSEVRFPQGTTSLLFSVSVPPFRRDGYPNAGQTLGCEPPLGFSCERIADASEEAGTVFFRLTRKLGQPSHLNPQLRLRLRRAVNELERAVPIVGEGASLFFRSGTPPEIALSFTEGQWACRWPSKDNRTHVESVHWYLGHTEVTASRGKTSIPPPDVAVPTPLLCVLVVSDADEGGRTVAFGQTLLMPKGPAFEDETTSLVVLSEGKVEFSRRILHAGAPLQNVRCTLIFTGTGTSREVACRLDAEGKETKQTRSLDTEPRQLTLSTFMSPHDVDALRRAILQEAKIDPFVPLSARLQVLLSTETYDFSLSSPLELVLPNARPRMILFSHFVDGKSRTSCVAQVEDPERNHVSLTLSPRFQTLSRSTFTTRESLVALASVRDLLPEGQMKLFGTQLLARTVLNSQQDGTGLDRAGCRAIVSDGTSLFEAFSLPSTESAVRGALLEQKEFTPTFAPTPREQATPQSHHAATLSPQTQQPSEENKLTVAQARAHFDAAGTHDLPLPPGAPLDFRLVTCEGPRALCSALFVSMGQLRLSLTSSVPGGTAFLQLENTVFPFNRMLLVADISNGTYAPLGTTPLPSCAELLFKQSRGGLPSFLQLATFSRVIGDDSGRLERAVPSSRVMAALSSGAEDIICEATLHWAGQTLGVRSSSLRESFLSKAGGRQAPFESPFSSNGLLPSLPSRRAPLDARLSLPALIAAAESEAREFAASFAAVEWKAKRCQVESIDGRAECRIDPASLLIYELPRNKDFTIDASVEHKVMGRSRKLRVVQSFRGRGPNSQTLLPGVLLRRSETHLECLVSGHFPAETLFRHELRLNSTVLGLSVSKETHRKFELTGTDTTAVTGALGETLKGALANSQGTYSCHVSWPGGAETAFLPSEDINSLQAVKGLCIVEDGTLEGPWAAPCDWPEGLPLGEASTQGDERLRQHFARTLNLSPSAWVKGIFSSTEVPWRASFLLSPISPRMSMTGIGAARESRLLPPWSHDRRLCLAENTDIQEKTAPMTGEGTRSHSLSTAETALNAGTSRLARTCGFLHSQVVPTAPPLGNLRSLDTSALYQNGVALGPSGPVLPSPFLSSARTAVSRMQARLTAFLGSTSVPSEGAREGSLDTRSHTCFLRCSGAATHPATVACEAALSEVLSKFESMTQGPKPPHGLKCERADWEGNTLTAPQDVSVLELIWKKRDTPSMPDVRVIGIVVP
ncbi:MAG: hypothetical protein IOD12_16000 [Silvanigrellales bacterium]|nr:hypothetical protein [Silvanigrellales bacterium]